MLCEIFLLSLDLSSPTLSSLDSLDLRSLLPCVLDSLERGELTGFLDLSTVSSFGFESFGLLMLLTLEKDPTLHLLVEPRVGLVPTILLGQSCGLSLSLSLPSSETFELSDELLFLGI